MACHAFIGYTRHLMPSLFRLHTAPARSHHDNLRPRIRVARLRSARVCARRSLAAPPLRSSRPPSGTQKYLLCKQSSPGWGTTPPRPFTPPSRPRRPTAGESSSFFPSGQYFVQGPIVVAPGLAQHYYFQLFLVLFLFLFFMCNSCVIRGNTMEPL